MLHKFATKINTPIYYSQGELDKWPNNTRETMDNNNSTKPPIN